jgi:hypothetical protein
MSENTDPNKASTLESLSKIVILFIPYFLLINIIYNYGFWYQLGIDIYSFTPVSDLVKGAAYVIGGVFVEMSVATLTMYFIMYNLLPLLVNRLWLLALIVVPFFIVTIIINTTDLQYTIHDYYVPNVVLGNEADPEISKEIQIPKMPGVLITLIPAVLTYLLSFKTANTLIFSKYKNILQLPFIKYSSNTTIEIIDRLKYTCIHATINLAIALPIWAYAIGLNDSRLLLKGTGFTYITKDTYANYTKLNKYPYLKYIGKSGSYIFLLPPDNTATIIVKEESIPTTFIYYHNSASPLNDGDLPRNAKRFNKIETDSTITQRSYIKPKN